MHERLVKPRIPTPGVGGGCHASQGKRDKAGGARRWGVRPLSQVHITQGRSVAGKVHSKVEALEINETSLDNICCRALGNPRVYILESGWDGEEAQEHADSPAHQEDGESPEAAGLTSSHHRDPSPGLVFSKDSRGVLRPRLEKVGGLWSLV